MCLYKLISETAKRKFRKKIPDLHIVLEAGHPNSGDVKRIFGEIKKEFSGRGGEMLRTFTLADKGDCGPLMMADFVAHSRLELDRTAAAGFPMPNPAPIERGAGGVIHMEATAETLAQLRTDTLGKIRPNQSVSFATSGEQPS